MNVLYDHQIFELQQFGGISRYFSELIREYKCNDTLSVSCAAKYSTNVHLRDLAIEYPSLKVTVPLLGRKNMRGMKTMQRLRDTFLPSLNPQRRNLESSINALRRGDVDLFHPTYFDAYFLEHLGSVPFVVTIYDMIYELFQDALAPDETARVLAGKKKMIDAASMIITISESTKKDIVRIYDLDANKVRVTHLASSLRPVSHFGISALPEQFILFVGKREAYKNFNLFFTALAPFLQKNKALSLVCTGPAFTREEEVLFSQYSLEKKVVHFFADETLLSALYANARAFIFPSIYEGFGIPVLEAFNCGCPVVISNTSSLPEVGGDAASYVDPADANSILFGVEKVLYDESYRTGLIERGLERAKKFSWKKTAKETALIYREVVHGHPT